MYIHILLELRDFLAILYLLSCIRIIDIKINYFFEKRKCDVFTVKLRPTSYVVMVIYDNHFWKLRQKKYILLFFLQTICHIYIHMYKYDFFMQFYTKYFYYNN